MPGSAPLAPAQLAERFGLGVPDVSRALFELNRGSGLRVTEQARDHAAQFVYDFDLLCEDLRQLNADQAPLMLAGADGLCLAQQGLPEEICIHQAAICHLGASKEFPCVIPLHLGARVVHLCSPVGIDAKSAALLSLARRLIGQQRLTRLDA